MINTMRSFFYKASNQFILFMISMFPFVASAHPGHGSEGSIMHAAEHGIWFCLALLIFAGLYSAILMVKSRFNKRPAKVKI